MKKIFTFGLLLAFSFLAAIDLQFGEIEFTGNEFVSDSELSQAITIETGEEFSMPAVKNSAAKISQYYKNRGYYNVIVLQPQIITEKPPAVDIKFQIIEQGRLRVEKVIFEGNHYLDSADFPPVAKLYLNEIPSYLENMIQYYNQMGFLFASAKIDEVQITDNTALVKISIKENDYCEFSKIRIRGNKVSTNNSIIRIADLNLNKNLQARDFSAAEARLRSREYIKDAAVIPLNSKEILIDLTEDRMTLFSGILGYDDSADDKFTGFFNFDFLNLLGSDRSLHFFWQKFAADSEELEFKYHESGPYRFPLEGDILLNRQQQDSTYIRSKLETEIFYKYASAKYGLYFGLENITPAGREDLSQIQKREYTKAGITLTYDDFDYSPNPRRGWQGRLKLYNIRQAETEVINRQALESIFARAQKINDRLVIYSKLQANLLENKNLASVDYWHLGGFHDLRGFVEDSFYGYYVGCVNLELRYLIAQRSRLFIFSDYGYAKNSLYTKGKLFGVGFGLRLETNLGVFGVDYGIGYADGNWRSPLDGIIHFGLETKL